MAMMGTRPAPPALADQVEPHDGQRPCHRGMGVPAQRALAGTRPRTASCTQPLRRGMAAAFKAPRGRHLFSLVPVRVAHGARGHAPHLEQTVLRAFSGEAACAFSRLSTGAKDAPSLVTSTACRTLQEGICRLELQEAPSVVTSTAPAYPPCPCRSAREPAPPVVKAVQSSLGRGTRTPPAPGAALQGGAPWPRLASPGAQAPHREHHARPISPPRTRGSGNPSCLTP